MEKKCPFTKTQKCMQDKCMFWTHLIGVNPQTGQSIDEFNCAISMLPILLIENAKNVAQAQSAVEKFKNKSVEFQDLLASAIKHSKNQLIAPKKRKKIKASESVVISEVETDKQSK